MAHDIEMWGAVTSDNFIGFDQAGGWNEPSLRAALEDLEGAVVELNVHPGADHDFDRLRYRWHHHGDDERRTLMGPDVRKAVASAGFVLTGPSAVIRYRPRQLPKP